MLLVAANFVRIVALNNVQANVGIEADGLSAWVLAYTQMPGSTPVFIAGITGIRKGDSIILSQQLGQFINVSYVGCRCGDRMNSAGIHIGAYMDNTIACLFRFDACLDHAIYPCFWWNWVHE